MKLFGSINRSSGVFVPLGQFEGHDNARLAWFKHPELFEMLPVILDSDDLNRWLSMFTESNGLDDHSSPATWAIYYDKEDRPTLFAVEGVFGYPWLDTSRRVIEQTCAEQGITAVFFMTSQQLANTYYSLGQNDRRMGR